MIDQAYSSSWGDDALDLLGDLSFQDGRFDEALALYRQIVPDRRSRGAGLVYPDPIVDLARVAAKKLLCRAALPDDPPGPADLAAFRKAYPGAERRTRGPRRAVSRRPLADGAEADHLAPPAQPDGRWPTFAGAPMRTQVVRGPGRRRLVPVAGGTGAGRAGRTMPRGDRRGMGFTIPQPPPTVAGVSSDRARRSGHRVRREPDPRLQPQRPPRQGSRRRRASSEAWEWHDEEQAVRPQAEPVAGRASPGSR